MIDNHIGRVRDNEYDKEQFYDERYDQSEIEINQKTQDIREEKKEEIRKVLVEPCRAYDLEESDF